MPIKVEDKELLRRFLLREVSEQERDEIEALYFSDPEFFERLLVAEDELVDEYLQGDLSAREREKFDRQYSASRFNEREIAFSQALHQAVAETCPAAPRRGWWQPVSDFLFPRGRAVVAWVSLAVLLLAVGLTWWQWSGPDTAEETERLQARGGGAGEEARRPGEGERPTPPVPSASGFPEDVSLKGVGEKDGRPAVATGGGLDRRAEDRRRPARPTELAPVPQPPYEVSLHSGVTLGATPDASPPLAIARGTKRVRLKIQVVKNEYQKYRVSLQAVGGGRVWQVRTPKGQADEAGEWVTVSVPASVFKGKDYILRVSADAPDGRTETLALRQLRVERQ